MLISITDYCYQGPAATDVHFFGTQDGTSHVITIFDTMRFAGTNQSETRKNIKRFTMIHMLEITFNRLMTDFRHYEKMTIEAHENHQTSNEKKHFSISSISQEHLILKSHHNRGKNLNFMAGIRLKF